MGSKNEIDSVYIKKKVTDLNAKEPGKGDDWLKEFNESKPYYLSEFISGFNHNSAEPLSAKIDSTADINSKENYVLTIERVLMIKFMDMDCLATTLTITHNGISVAKFVINTAFNKRCAKKIRNDCHGVYSGTFYMAGYMLVNFFDKYVYNSKNWHRVDL